MNHPSDLEENKEVTKIADFQSDLFVLTEDIRKEIERITKNIKALPQKLKTEEEKEQFHKSTSEFFHNHSNIARYSALIERLKIKQLRILSDILNTLVKTDGYDPSRANQFKQRVNALEAKSKTIPMIRIIEEEEAADIVG